MKFPWSALGIVVVFAIAYCALGLIKHNHFLSGYDLAIVDQITWKYSQFLQPITTVHAYPFTSIFTDHIEFIYLFLSPLFWVFHDSSTLIAVQAIFFCLSGIPIYLLAKRKGLNEVLSLTLLFSYLFFYGVQNALWNDVHSNVFGAGFIAWLIYFLDNGNLWGIWISFFLAITSKEDMAFLTLGIGMAWMVKTLMSFPRESPPLAEKRESRIFPGSPIKSGMTWVKKLLLSSSPFTLSACIIFFSLFYLFLVFVVYFPHFTTQGYRFASHEPLLQNLNPSYFIDTVSKRQIILYSLGWFGFLPLFAPLYLLPAFFDLFHYFVLGHAVESASEIFLHYRVSLAPLLIWPSVEGIRLLINKMQFIFRHPERSEGSHSKNRDSSLHPAKRDLVQNDKRNNILQTSLAIYLLFCTFVIQYAFHLPLSYLTKSWFWQTPKSVATINDVLRSLPPTASVVSQNNITPHISHRDLIFTLWPDVHTYKTVQESPCGKISCRWFHWVGNPKYMIVDTGPDWDIRHFLANRPDFLEALHNFETMGKITVYKREGTTTLYKVLQKP